MNDSILIIAEKIQWNSTYWYELTKPNRMIMNELETKGENSLRKKQREIDDR